MILDIFHEEDGLTAVTGSVNVDITVPADEEWSVQLFGGTSNKCSCEIQLRWSEDGGETWANPFDPHGSDERIRVIHLSSDSANQVSLRNGLIFSDGIIRVTLKNYGASAAEVGFWLNGERRDIG